MSLQRVAEALAARGQRDLAREVAEVSLQIKGATGKTAAAEVEFKDLPKEQQDFAKSLASHFGKPGQCWDGIHGYIVTFTGKVHGGRITKDVLKKMVSSDIFRWMDVEGETVSVGI